jgi:hypothetical protein
MIATWWPRSDLATGAVDRDFKGSADLAHRHVGKSAKSADQDCDRHAFDRVQVDRRAAQYRIGKFISTTSPVDGSTAYN